MTAPDQPARINGEPHLTGTPDPDDDHEPVPVRDSLTRARDKAPADPFEPGDYPINATCDTCQQPVYAESFLRQFTHHVPPAPATAPA